MALGTTALWSGCQRNGDGTDATAEVTLRFATRTGGDGTGTANDPNATEEEGIKTLRIIVRDEIAGEIVRNEKRTFGTETQPLLEKEVKVYDLPLSTYTFYLIANEGSVDKTYDTPEAIRADFVEVNGMQKLLVVDEGWNFFPQAAEEIEENGLPMAGMKTVEITEDTESLDITLERAVAKLNLTIENALTEDITVKNINFGNFMSDRVYLFRTQNIDMPDGIAYRSWQHLCHLVVPAGENRTFVGYVYPSYAPGNYTLGLETEGGSYAPARIMSGGNPMTFMRRNSQVNIRAVINTEASINIDYTVTDWESAPVSVPPFN